MISDFLMLDIRTMAFVSSVSGFLMAATMLGIHCAGMRARAMLDWFMAGLAFGFGYLVGNIAQFAAWPFADEFGISLANSLITVGHGFVLIGVQRYLGLRARTGILLALVAVLFIAGIAFEPLRESINARIILFSTLHLALTVLAGILLWRSHRPGMRAFHRMAALVLLGFSGVLAFRFGNALGVPVFQDLVALDAMQGMAFLVAMIFGFLLTMALAVMMFREKQVELTDLAEKDPLTGMNNRLSLDGIAGKYMERAERHGLELSVMLFDLDHFKRVNDEFGHQVGDRVLTELAMRINQIMRGNDVAFRFGGEEFLALLPGAGLEQAEQVAERLRRAIADEPIVVDGHHLNLTASFGVVQYMPGKETWDGCVRRVDEALYRAKRGGRDRIARYVPVSIAAP